MTLLPVPCPVCGGLVERPSVKCTRCGAQWITARELLFDGLCLFSDRANKIAECQEWDTVPAAVQGMQDVQDALAVRHKYDIELERLEQR
jgi:hypothetical protein